MLGMYQNFGTLSLIMLVSKQSSHIKICPCIGASETMFTSSQYKNYSVMQNRGTKNNGGMSIG